MHLLDKSRKRVGAAGKKKNAEECIMRASSSLAQAFIYTLVSSAAAAAGKGEKRREDTVHQSCAPAQPKGREHITELHAPFSAAASAL